MINPDDTGARTLATGTLHVGEPSWSPNGRLIAFSGVKTNCDPLTASPGCDAIFVVNENGTGLRRLTPYWAFSRVPAWSPDGTQIAFTGKQLDDNGNDEGSIYLMAANGTHRHLLLRQPKPWVTEPLVWQH